MHISSDYNHKSVTVHSCQHTLRLFSQTHSYFQLLKYLPSEFLLAGLSIIPIKSQDTFIGHMTEVAVNDPAQVLGVLQPQQPLQLTCSLDCSTLFLKYFITHKVKYADIQCREGTTESFSLEDTHMIIKPNHPPNHKTINFL